MKDNNEKNSEEKKQPNFIRHIIEEDIKNNKHNGRVAMRFPPEPNGCLHIGHAKAICVNFGLAKEFGGTCNLRFDDTNPAKEEILFVESIQNDIKWLGFDWGEHLFFASDYFDKLYELATKLIEMGKAYVCDLNETEIREYRGTLKNSGKNSPYRDRTAQENLSLFSQMKEGKFEDGKCVLRAKIDMASPNIPMRDPVIYRIKHAHHIKTGDKWCIYPMYDFTHCLSDSIENITHSCCSLEFENHRPLYNWFINELDMEAKPHQYEFARLNLDYTVMSKRKLMNLINEKIVTGWDDPRMPTLSGLKRRGFTPTSIRNFCEIIGVGKADSRIDLGVLEYCIREDLNENATRKMAVINPLKVIIDNFPDEKVEEISATNHPQNENLGTRKIPFTKEIFIEREDFLENPPKKFFRLSPGSEVRLKYAYYITCTDVIKNENGDILEIHATYDPATKGGSSPDKRKVKGTIHWVSTSNSIKAQIRLYDRLFSEKNPEANENFKDCINENSLNITKNAYVENSLTNPVIGSKYQFERLGYFCVDKDSTPKSPVFNRIVTLKDTWSKITEKSST